MFKNLPRASSAARKFHKLDEVRSRILLETPANEIAAVIVPGLRPRDSTQILFDFSVRLHANLQVFKA